MKYPINVALNNILNSKTIDLVFLKKIKLITTIDSIDKNRLLVDLDSKKIYYINDLNQEIELEIQTNTDTGEYQVIANNNIIYSSSNNNSINNNTGNSNSLTKTRSIPGIGKVDTPNHEGVGIDMTKAAFVKIGFLVLTSILISIALASLILLLK